MNSQIIETRKSTEYIQLNSKLHNWRETSGCKWSQKKRASEIVYSHIHIQVFMWLESGEWLIFFVS
jgi:hypothetical protein